MIKKKKVLTVHRAAITVPKDKNQRWQTYIKCDDGNSKKVSANSEGILYEKLYDHYFVNVIPTMKAYYEKWIEHRESENISHKTILRYHNYWNKYYLNDPIVNKKLNTNTSRNIEDFFHKQIKEHGLTTKELGNMKVILKNMLETAKSAGTISTNPFLEANIKTFGCLPPTKHQDESRIYLKEEKEHFFEALNDEICHYPDCTDMHGIFLLFSKGIRIAELAAIKVSDIDFKKKQIYIHRMETVLKDVNGENYTTVVDYGKKRSPYALRWLDLADFEIELVKDVLKISQRLPNIDKEFLFRDNQGRTTVREFDNRIRKMCRKIGIEEKSAHDIRRTVASQLSADGLSLESIREILGHSDIKTTQSYIYDLDSKESRRKMLNNSLLKMNGLKRTNAD